jgi:hypothetical protein
MSGWSIDPLAVYIALPAMCVKETKGRIHCERRGPKTAMTSA